MNLIIFFHTDQILSFTALNIPVDRKNYIMIIPWANLNDTERLVHLLSFLKDQKIWLELCSTHDNLTYSFVVWHVINTCMRISLVKLSSRMWTLLHPILCTLRGCVMIEHILLKIPIFSLVTKVYFIPTLN